MLIKVNKKNLIIKYDSWDALPKIEIQDLCKFEAQGFREIVTKFCKGQFYLCTITIDKDTNVNLLPLVKRLQVELDLQEIDPECYEIVKKICGGREIGLNVGNHPERIKDFCVSKVTCTEISDYDLLHINKQIELVYNSEDPLPFSILTLVHTLRKKTWCDEESKYEPKIHTLYLDHFDGNKIPKSITKLVIKEEINFDFELDCPNLKELVVNSIGLIRLQLLYDSGVRIFKIVDPKILFSELANLGKGYLKSRMPEIKLVY